MGSKKIVFGIFKRDNNVYATVVPASKTILKKLSEAILRLIV